MRARARTSLDLDRSEILLGGLATIALFSLIVGCIAGAIGTSLGTASSEGIPLIVVAGIGAAVGLLAFVVALITAAVAATVVAIVGVPLAFAVAVLLRRTRRVVVHVVTYFLMGSLLAAAGFELLMRTISSVNIDEPSPWGSVQSLAVVAVVAGTSGVAGWLCALRIHRRSIGLEDST